MSDRLFVCRRCGYEAPCEKWEFVEHDCPAAGVAQREKRATIQCESCQACVERSTDVAMCLPCADRLRAMRGDVRANSATCKDCVGGVSVYTDGGRAYAKLVTVRLCPLHAEAEAMRDLLKRLCDVHDTGDGYDMCCVTSDARALLARLEPKP